MTIFLDIPLGYPIYTIECFLIIKKIDAKEWLSSNESQLVDLWIEHLLNNIGNNIRIDAQTHYRVWVLFNFRIYWRISYVNNDDIEMWFWGFVIVYTAVRNLCSSLYAFVRKNTAIYEHFFENTWVYHPCLFVPVHITRWYVSHSVLSMHHASLDGISSTSCLCGILCSP